MGKMEGGGGSKQSVASRRQKGNDAKHFKNDNADIFREMIWSKLATFHCLQLGNTFAFVSSGNLKLEGTENEQWKGSCLFFSTTSHPPKSLLASFRFITLVGKTCPLTTDLIWLILKQWLMKFSRIQSWCFICKHTKDSIHCPDTIPSCT